MKIAILQLSDIHIKKNQNTILEKEERLFNSISNDLIGNDIVFIAITGDIAYSGTKEEYDIAEKFLKSLESRIKDYNKIDVQFIFCPGNHDCDFSINTDVRNALIEGALRAPDNIKYGIVDLCSQSQNEYFNFIARFESHQNIQTDLSNKLFSLYRYQIGDFTVSFNSYNVS